MACNWSVDQRSRPCPVHPAVIDYVVLIHFSRNEQPNLIPKSVWIDQNLILVPKTRGLLANISSVHRKVLFSL